MHLPPVRAGEHTSHTLRATITGPELVIFADKILVWRGALPAEVFHTHGPAGIHCDNAKLEIMLTVAPPVAGAPILPCAVAANPTNGSLQGPRDIFHISEMGLCWRS